MFYLRQPPRESLDRLLREQSAAELTYSEVGATAAALPGGYRHDRAQADLGPFDDARFARAVARISGATRSTSLAAFRSTM